MEGARVTKQRWVTASVATAWLLLRTQTANAHLVSTGMGPVYDSLLHLLQSPQQLAPILGLALWTGLLGPNHGRWALFTVTGAWLSGGLLGPALFPPGALGPLWTAGSCLTLGVLVAAELRTPVALTTTLAGLIGLVEGAMTGTGDGSAHRLPEVLGTTTGVLVLMAITTSLIVPLRRLWQRMAVRVAGSWLAALGLLLVGWIIRARL